MASRPIKKLVPNILLCRNAIIRTNSIRSGNFSTSYPLGRGIKVIKHVLHSQGQNLGANTERGEARFDCNEVVGLLDGPHDGLHIEGLDGAEVDDFSLNAILFLQLVGGNKGLTDASR